MLLFVVVILFKKNLVEIFIILNLWWNTNQNDINFQKLKKIVLENQADEGDIVRFGKELWYYIFFIRLFLAARVEAFWFVFYLITP